MHRVLFLCATNNSGHKKAAEAVQKSLMQLNPGAECSCIDFFTHSYPLLGPLLSRIYIEILRSIPHAWDYLYGNADFAELTVELRQFFNLLNIPKLHKVLKNYSPDIIVCTQAIPAGFISHEKDMGRINVPHMAVVTDFAAHPYWPEQNVDNYFVPNEEAMNDLKKRGIPENRICVTGIPINPSFSVSIPKNFARKKLGLRPAVRTALVLGGSQGLGHISEALRVLLTVRNIQIIAVAGYNRPLYRQLKRDLGSHKNIFIFGHVKNMSRLMDAADAVISKPGGLTCAEALAKGLPMIIMSPLPGQEERNAAYLMKHNVAERCDNIKHLPALVQGLLNNPQKLIKCGFRALSLSRPNASQLIASRILEHLYER
ncbi:MAG: glycosyltransferase [Elusimicrobiota bacterium]